MSVEQDGATPTSHEGVDFRLDVPPSVSFGKSVTASQLMQKLVELQSWCGNTYLQFKTAAALLDDAVKSNQFAMRQFSEVNDAYVHLGGIVVPEIVARIDSLQKEQEVHGIMFNKFANDYVGLYEQIEHVQVYLNELNAAIQRYTVKQKKHKKGKKHNDR